MRPWSVLWPTFLVILLTHHRIIQNLNLPTVIVTMYVAKHRMPQKSAGFCCFFFLIIPCSFQDSLQHHCSFCFSTGFCQYSFYFSSISFLEPGENAYNLERNCESGRIQAKYCYMYTCLYCAYKASFSQSQFQFFTELWIANFL